MAYLNLLPTSSCRRDEETTTNLSEEPGTQTYSK